MGEFSNTQPSAQYIVSSVTVGERMTYRAFNNLFRLILPILGVRIPFRDFRCLLLRTTPQHFNVREFVVRVKDCKRAGKYTINHCGTNLTKR
jgi:hypothetical protein